MIKFISYDGSYPNLCSGTLVIDIDGKIYSEGIRLHSGGNVSFTDTGDEIVDEGEWTVDVPEKLVDYKDDIESVVNENIPYGCCGGCI